MSPLIQSFCFTLLHSLWQGLVFAVITGMVMVLTRSSRASLRYNCLVLLLGGFLLTTGITFWWELSSHLVSANPQLVTGNLQLETSNQELAIIPVTAIQHTLREKWAEYFTTHASLVVLVWCMLFCARLVQLLASLGYIQRVKHYKTQTPAAYWQEQLGILAARLQLQKKISLLESGIIKVPMAVGWLKPVILVPLGLLASLPTDEIEAILLHELAHIRRRDYLVNLLQSFVQAIFFFNPAIIWISALIREERENCCDDIAIAATNNRKQLVKALVAFQEYNLRNTRYAMTFPGKKQHLLNRVKRIIHNRNKTLNTMEKSLLSLGIAAAIIFSLASASTIPPVTNNQQSAISSQQSVVSNQRLATSNQQSVISDLASVAFHRTRGLIPPAAMQTIPVMNDTTPAMLRDTLPAKHKKTPQPKSAGAIQTEGNGYTNIVTATEIDGSVTIVTTTAIANDGTRYAFKKIDGSLVELTVNGVGIPNEAHKEYSVAIEKVEMAQHRNIEAAMARHRADQQQQRKDQEEKRRNIALQAEMRNARREMDNGMNAGIKKAEANMQKMDQQKQLSDEQRQALQKQLIEMKGYRDSINKVIDATIRKMSAVNNPKLFSDTTHIALKKITSQYQWQAKPGQWHRDSIAYAIKAENLKRRAAEDKIRLQVSANTIRNIIADLAKENIIVDIDRSWFGLDAKQFIVDGKPIDGEIYEKFKAKYLKTDGMGYYYGPVQVSGRGIFMDKQSIGK